MLNIDYQDKTFTIRFKSDSEEQFQEYLSFCKRLYLSYDINKKTWSCSEKNIDEFLLWIDKYNYYFTFSEKAEQRFNEIQKEWNTSEVKFYRNVKFDKENILKEGKVLFDFQMEDVLWGLGRNNFNNFNSCGCGKTSETICVFSQRYLNKEIDGIFITVKTGTTLAWKDEILEWTKIFTEEDIGIIDNDNKIKPFDNFKDKKIIICPDHILSKVFTSYRTKKIKSEKHLRFDKTPDIRILWGKESLFYVQDESHRIKHFDRIRTRQALALKPFFNYVCTLSGTPAINDFVQIYNQLYMIDKSIIGMSRFAFNVWIADQIGSKWNTYEVIKYDEQKVKTVLDKMKMYCIQRLKEDLPEMKTRKIFRPIPLELSPLQNELYRLISWVELYILTEEFDQLSIKLILNKFPYTMSLFDNPLLLQNKKWEDENIQKKVDAYKIENDPKFMTLKAFLEDYVDELGEKVVVYFCHPKTGDMLAEKFKNYKPLLIHGQLQGVKDKEMYRRQVELDFNTKETNRVLFLSALTSSESINLNKKCRRIIIYETPPSAVEFSQLQDRIYRINNTQDAIVECLYYRNTIDNIRLNRNMNRLNLNENLTKNISVEMLKDLLKGIVKNVN